ncbi:hypothetical protein F511_23868 [Dorcoceras hygrometricum]|uniref:U5 small nuclear ribonucleoprotein TSSC4 n=1 Tax=Dorcoceras hygrometricum TaxID=472368 RepID=A0A2Z7CKM4_9LAMI|nr:hypothetical protein F511_23868 [Dorcoceras hygrometricum]
MEDSFRCRVDKAFGSLGSTAAVSPSLWSLTDDEIERREWNRSKNIEEEEEEEEDVDEPEPSGFRAQFEEDLRDSDARDDEVEEIDGEKQRRPIRDVESVADEHWDVQSNIGLDCTLDYEEEEDEYDKVAVGMENTGDRLYMRDVKFADYKVDELNTHSELPNSFKVAVRDPRANHMAAKIRLKEDAEAAGNFDSLQLSEKSVTMNSGVVELRKGELDYDNPKSILKKRENVIESRSHKRVRFMFDLKNNAQNQDEQQCPGDNDFTSEACTKGDVTVPEQASELFQDRPGVPDYIRNPSKYTRYTFDSSDDMDDQSNRKAYMDLFHHLRQKTSECSSMHDASVDTPKSVIFTPKRKQNDSMVEGNETKPHFEDHLKNKGRSVASTSVNALETEVSAMDEDELLPEVDKGYTFPKPARQYRTRATIVQLDDNVS